VKRTKWAKISGVAREVLEKFEFGKRYQIFLANVLLYRNYTHPKRIEYILEWNLVNPSV